MPLKTQNKKIMEKEAIYYEMEKQTAYSYLHRVDLEKLSQIKKGPKGPPNVKSCRF